ncbi:unnamed protein product, partial [Prorocentrum cordatum]
VRGNSIAAANMVDCAGTAGAQWGSRGWKSSFGRVKILDRRELPRETAREEDWAPIAIESLNNAIGAMAQSKAKEVEQPASAFKWLPPRAKGGLRQLVEESERQGAWPWQLMIAPVGLSPKGAGGDGAIGSPPEVVKLRSKMRGEYTGKWATTMAGERGAAIALKEASVRSFADGALERLPMKVYTFYETLEPALILGEGLRLGTPARALHLDMSSHSSARLIRDRTARAEPIAPDRWICAGARRGIDFGRVALYAVLKKVSAKFWRAHVRSRAGDVTARMECSRKEVARQLSSAGAGFASGAKRAKPTLSTKSALTGNDSDVGNEVARRLQSRNIAAKVKHQAPDLGIDRVRSIAGGEGARAKRAAHADR